MRVLCEWTLKARNRATFAASLPAPATGKAAGKGDNSSRRSYLDGQLLIAMPVMGDPRFERSVIYMCAHSADGAMGIMVNRPAGSIDFPELLVQLNIINKDDQIKLPDTAESMKVLRGGPVDTGRGFVLHSSDFFLDNATLPIDDGICLTATVDILKAIAKGSGPEARDPRARLCRLGRRASSRTKSRAMAGCIATPMPISSSATTSTRNTPARCARSASIPACCRTRRGTR